MKPRGEGGDAAAAPSRASPEELLRISRETAPHLPPAQMRVPPAPVAAAAVPRPAEGKGGAGAGDSTDAFALRMRTRTLASLARVARAKGMTKKQIICLGMQAMGVEVEGADLEDRTPRRRFDDEG